MRIDLGYYGLLKEESSHYQELPALYYYGKIITFADLLAQIHGLAGGLLAKGIKKGDIITIFLPNIPQSVIAFYAVNQLGAIANMVHPLLPLAQLTEIMNKTGSSLIFCLPSSYEALKPLALEKNWHLILCSPSGYVEKDLDWTSAWVYEQLAADKPFLQDRGDGVSPAIYLHSGGTTGKPKTIVLAAVQLNTLAAQISYILGEGSHRGEKALSVLPFFHGFGLCLGLHGLLIHGMAGVLLAKFHKEEATRLIIEHKIEYLLGVPNIFAALLAAKGFHGEDLSFIKGCFVGGDSINPQLRQAFNSHLAQNGSQASLQEGYGLTEMVTVAAVNRQSSHKDGSVGQALPGIKVKICALADDEGGFAPLPLGQEGEICLCGLTMMLGYLDDPMATAQTIRSHEDGELWVHTGDWGYLDADDFLWFRQRIKRMIKIGGFNIFPSEVENCLLDLDFIREACAIAIEDEGKIQGIKVFLSLNREMAEEEAQNLADQYCRKQLPFWSLPSYWEICPALPLTSVGKADFHALEKMEKARVK